MTRAAHVTIRLLFCATPFAAAPAAVADGNETFANFPVTTNQYLTGTFLGHDGSTWSYANCQGSKIITAPRTPGLDRVTNAYVESGTIAGGCGTLSFDWMQMFSSAVSFNVLINGTVRHTITGGMQNVVIHTGPITINVGGNFTLRIQQRNSQSRQVAIDNLAWTAYGGSAPEAPTLLFSPDTNAVLTAYSNAITLTVTATEPNVDEVRLWATGLPAGAAFNAATGTTPLISAFSWTPAPAQTGAHAVVFWAGDKDGTNSRAFAIEVTPIYPYYHYAEGLTGTVLRAKLHDIISRGARQLDDTQENDAMKVLHTDPANADNVLLLYNPTSSVPKSAYNDSPNGWNKEHAWPESRGLGNDGPDQVDVHNLFAEHIGANALRGNLYFDESDPLDPGYRAPATNVAPLTSMDSDSFEPPPASKGNVARAVFYMATRYDGTADKTSALWFSDDPSHTNSMGRLATLLLWHVLDPPDAFESNKNELIYANFQSNRNPYVDHPEWVEEIFGVDSDGDGVTDTHEIIAGTATNNPGSVFKASLSPTQIVCGALSSGSVWRLYQGFFVSNDIVWRQVAQTSNLLSGTLRFDVAPTSPATFYHLRALRP